MATDLTDRLAAALGRIIDDPLVVRLLLSRDPEAWTEAVEALGAHERVGDDDPRVPPAFDRIPASLGGPFTADD